CHASTPDRVTDAPRQRGLTVAADLDVERRRLGAQCRLGDRRRHGRERDPGKLCQVGMERAGDALEELGLGPQCQVVERPILMTLEEPLTGLLPELGGVLVRTLPRRRLRVAL